MSKYIYDNLVEGESYRVDEIVDEHPGVILDCIDNGRVNKADNRISVDKNYLEDVTSFDYKKPSNYARSFDKGTDRLMEIIGSVPPMTNAEMSGFSRVSKNFDPYENSKFQKDMAIALAERNNMESKLGKYATGIGGSAAYLSSDPWITLGGVAGLLGGPLINSYCRGKREQYVREAIKGWDTYTRGEFRNWTIEKEK